MGQFENMFNEVSDSIITTMKGKTEEKVVVPPVVAKVEVPKEPLKEAVNEDLQFEITDEEELRAAANELSVAVMNKEWSEVGDIASNIASYITKSKPITREDDIDTRRRAAGVPQHKRKPNKSKTDEKLTTSSDTSGQPADAAAADKVAKKSAAHNKKQEGK